MNTFEIRPATASELSGYFAFSRSAQQRLRDLALAQYVPSAHAEYEESFRVKQRHGKVLAVVVDGVLAGAFCLDDEPARWWGDGASDALYLSSIVLSPEMRGRGIEAEIFRCCAERVRPRQDAVAP
ncbi:MAG TPA: GNAT family N-acetyltransferase [Planctomycetota bacterium]|nr:GNAT family N-acetyltransferase [Planctomycetota bacterium]